LEFCNGISIKKLRSCPLKWWKEFHNSYIKFRYNTQVHLENGR